MAEKDSSSAAYVCRLLVAQAHSVEQHAGSGTTPARSERHHLNYLGLDGVRRRNKLQKVGKTLRSPFDRVAHRVYC